MIKQVNDLTGRQIAAIFGHRVSVSPGVASEKGEVSLGFEP